MHVPVPPRGYWNKKAAGKPALKLELPTRPPGLNDGVVVAGGPYASYNQFTLSTDEILGPIPPAPAYTETMVHLRKRLEALLPKVSVSRDLEAPHPAVAMLLKRDDQKRERQKGLSYVSAWDAPRYDTPIQRRRLRLLSAIFQALGNRGCRVDTRGGHPFDGPLNDFTITVGHQTVRLEAAVVQTKTAARGSQPASVSTGTLRFTLEPGRDSRPGVQSWKDESITLEQQARDIVVAVMLEGEQQYRNATSRSHARRIELKAATIARLEKERIEAERKEREHQAVLERQRVEDLLADAVSFRQARDIKAYVEEARAANAEALNPVPAEDMDLWAKWAIAQADRIDPVRTGAFRQELAYQSEQEPE